jgi:tetratricopeptide (TPR) repeat protein
MRQKSGIQGKPILPAPSVFPALSFRFVFLFPFSFFLFSILSGCTSFETGARLRELNEDGVFLYHKGDYARARENFELALSLKPEDPGLVYNVGQCYERQGNAKKAEECYRLCLKKDENHVEGQVALTSLLMKQGRKTEAKEVVHTWLASQPKEAGAYAQDGWRLHQEGDELKAMARVQQALDVDPHNVHALVHMGRLYEAMERPDRALSLYEQALARDPNRTDVRNHINELIAKGVHPPLPDS